MSMNYSTKNVIRRISLLTYLLRCWLSLLMLIVCSLAALCCCCLLDACFWMKWSDRVYKLSTFRFGLEWDLFATFERFFISCIWFWTWKWTENVPIGFLLVNRELLFFAFVDRDFFVCITVEATLFKMEVQCLIRNLTWYISLFIQF